MRVSVCEEVGCHKAGARAVSIACQCPKPHLEVRAILP
jgi:hypothetical protein